MNFVVYFLRIFKVFGYFGGIFSEVYGVFGGDCGVSGDGWCYLLFL